MGSGARIKRMLGTQGMASTLPLPPARPEAVLVLQLLLSGRSPDLAAISDLIRSDIGLLIQTMRLASSQLGSCDAIPVRMEELVVLLGISELQALSKTASILSVPKGRLSALTAFDRFTTHAQLTALIAQELAAETGTIEPEEAYLGGFCRRLADLPAVLGWSVIYSNHDHLGTLARRLGEEWSLPPLFVPIIAGNRTECPDSLLALFDVVEYADGRAQMLESGYTN